MSEAKEPNVEFSSLVCEHLLDAVDESTEQIQTWGEQFEQANAIRFRLDGVERPTKE